MSPKIVRRRAGAGQPVSRCISTLTFRRKQWMELNGRFAIGEGGAELLSAVEVRGSGPRAPVRSDGPTDTPGATFDEQRKCWGCLGCDKARQGSARGTIITDAARDIVATLLRESATSHRSRATRSR